MTDPRLQFRRKRLLEMLDKIRATFPDWGFVVGVAEIDSNKIWGWSNMKESLWVLRYLVDAEETGKTEKVNRLDRQ